MSSPSSRYRNNGIKFFPGGGVFITYKDWHSGIFANANTHIHKQRALVSGQFQPEVITPDKHFYSPITGGYWFNAGSAISWDHNASSAYLYKNGQRLLVNLAYPFYAIIAACIDNSGNTVAVVIKKDVLTGNNYDLLIIKYNKFTSSQIYSRVFYSFTSIYDVIYQLGNKSSFLNDCTTFVFINTDGENVIDNNAIFFKFSANYSANEYHAMDINRCNAMFYSQNYITLSVFDNITGELSTIRITAHGEESIINRYPTTDRYLILWIDDNNELSYKAMLLTDPAVGTLYLNGDEIWSGEFIDSMMDVLTRIPQSAFDGTLLTADFASGTQGGNIMINVKTGQSRMIDYSLSLNTSNGAYFPLTVSEYKVTP
jgi:hypothetical protein